MKLTFPLLNTTIHVPVDDSVSSAKQNRRLVMRKNRLLETEKGRKIEETTTPESKAPENTEETVNPAEPAPQASSQPLLMVEVVNVTHEKFRQTEEIKVNVQNILHPSIIDK